MHDPISEIKEEVIQRQLSLSNHDDALSIWPELYTEVCSLGNSISSKDLKRLKQKLIKISAISVEALNNLGE